MPGFIKPQFATPKSKAPTGEIWLHEIKFGGYRAQLHASGRRVAVYTRNGLDWSKRFAAKAKAFDVQGCAIFDGEAVVISTAEPTSPSFRRYLRAAGKTASSRLRPTVPRCTG
jgi:bifunctional non-homologous end joining protein LigD